MTMVRQPGFRMLPVVLAAGVLLLGPRVLILVALAAAVATTVLDLMEVTRQLALANGTVATLAILVALSHSAIVILSVLVLRRYEGSRRRDGEVAA